MKDCVCPIQWHEAIGGDYYRLGFRHTAGGFQPGQFAMVKVPGDEILLRRPFSLCQIRDGSWEILYKVVGSGTRMMATLAPGDHLEVFGPLGHPFSHSEKPILFFVAGGYGIAPFLG